MNLFKEVGIEFVIMEDETKQAKVLVSTELQGRVMTSSVEGDKGAGFGRKYC